MNQEYAPGSLDHAIEEWEMDNGWEPGTIANHPGHRAHFERKWLKSGNGNNGAKTRARNQAKGVSQKNLKGSTKQKKWATDLRADKIKAMSEVDAKRFYDYVGAAKFWIENRNRTATQIVARLNELVAKRDAVLTELKATGYVEGTNMSHAQSAFVDRYNRANDVVSAFIAGDIQ